MGEIEQYLIDMDGKVLIVIRKLIGNGREERLGCVSVVVSVRSGKEKAGTECIYSGCIFRYRFCDG